MEKYDALGVPLQVCEEGFALDFIIADEYIMHMCSWRRFLCCFMVMVSMLALLSLIYMTGGIIVLGMFMVCVLLLVIGKKRDDTQLVPETALCSVFITSLLIAWLYFLYRDDVQGVCEGTWIPAGLRGVLPYVATILLAFLLVPSIHLLGRRFSFEVSPSLQQFIYSAYSYYILIGVGILSVVGMSVACMNESIWLDEAYTMGFVTSDWSEMVRLVALDVHPPLYYAIVKGVIQVGMWGGFSGVSPIIFAKLASVIPFAMLLVVGLSIIRRRWGRYVSGLFVLAVTGVPSLMSLGCDMRMYSWALLFVTLTYLSAFFVVERGGFKMWCMLVIWSLCAAYTHYFAIVAVMPAFLYVLHAGRKVILPWLLSCLVIVCAYSPWLVVFIRQLQVVRENYWIAPMTAPKVVNFLSSVVEGVFGCGLMVLLSGIVRKKRLMRPTQDSLLCFDWMAISIPIFVITVGVLVSVSMRPVFGVRYVYPTLGVFWLGISLMLGRQKRSIRGVAVPVLLVMISLFYLRVLLKTEYGELLRNRDFVAMADKLHKPFYMGEDVHRVASASIISNSPASLWKWTAATDPLVTEVFDVTLTESPQQIRERLIAGFDVLYLAVSEEEKDRFVERTGLTCTLVGFYLVSWDTYVYRVSL